MGMVMVAVRVYGSGHDDGLRPMGGWALGCVGGAAAVPKISFRLPQCAMGLEQARSTSLILWLLWLETLYIKFSLSGLEN